REYNFPWWRVWGWFVKNAHGISIDVSACVIRKDDSQIRRAYRYKSQLLPQRATNIRAWIQQLIDRNRRQKSAAIINSIGTVRRPVSRVVESYPSRPYT